MNRTTFWTVFAWVSSATVIFGFIVPPLISAASNLLVATGIGIGLAYVAGLGVVLNRKWKKQEKNQQIEEMRNAYEQDAVDANAAISDRDGMQQGSGGVRGNQGLSARKRQRS